MDDPTFDLLRRALAEAVVDRNQAFMELGRTVLRQRRPPADLVDRLQYARGRIRAVFALAEASGLKGELLDCYLRDM